MACSEQFRDEMASSSGDQGPSHGRSRQASTDTSAELGSRRKRIKRGHHKEVVQQTHESGYDAHFDPPLDKKLECPICLYALRDPIQTPCGHRFCRACIEKSLSADSKTCPVDKRKLLKSDIYPDNWCRREVMCLRCKCRHFEDGCAWHGQLKDYEDHLGTSCQYVAVACPNAGCDQQVQRSDMQHHLDNDCDYRVNVCQYCGDSIPAHDLEAHQADHCPRYPQECPKGCGMQVPRCEVLQHVASLCERAEVACAYESCDWRGIRTDYAAHCQESVPAHLAISNQKIASQTSAMAIVQENLVHLQAQITGARDVVDDMRASSSGDSQAMEMARTLSDKLVNISRVVDHTVLRVSDVESRIIQLERRVTSDRAALNALSDKLDCTTTAFQNNMAKLITVIEQSAGSGHYSSTGKSMPSMPSIPPMQSLTSAATAAGQQTSSNNITTLFSNTPSPADPAVSYDGTMVWKLCRWSELRADAISGKRTSVYSSPFYTSVRGFKVRLRLYPNGDGMGKGNCVSVFFTLCRGEFDAILPWPFRNKVTFSLLDQTGGSVNLSESFVPDANSSSFHRPKSDMNIASGCPLFVPCGRVTHEGQYLLNDTIMIRVAVDQKTIH